MNNEWITDRMPTEKDAYRDLLWVTICGELLITDYINVSENQPWMPIVLPEPYVKPKRVFVVWSELFNCWALRELPKGGEIPLADPILNVGLIKKNEQHREAAERIAAIYEEVMP